MRPALHKTLLACTHALSVAGLLLLALLPAHKYGWMAELESSATAELLADAGGNRLPFTLVVAGAVVVLQAVAAWRARRLWQRWFSVAVMLASAALWWTKFGA